MAVDEKINEKVQAGKALTKEETTAILQDQGPVEGYSKMDGIEDMTPEQFDNETEEKPATETKDGETEGAETEQKPAEAETKEAKPETAKKPETKEKSKEQPPEKEDLMVRLERELSKEEGKEDLKNFTDREKAYFHSMRRDRKRAQKAESELDIERRERIKLKTELDKKPVVKEEKPNPIEMLKKKDPTDYMTVAEVVGLVESLQPAAPEKKEDNQEIESRVDPRTDRYLKMCEKEAREAHPDFDIVAELTQDIIMSNPKHLTEVAKAMQSGENPALKAYELIKADPEFAKLYPVAEIKVKARTTPKAPEKKEEKTEEKPKEPAAKTEKEKRVAEAEKALEENQNKTKTTGSVETSGADDDPESMEAYAALPDREFAKLPKKTRAKVLRWMEGV